MVGTGVVVGWRRAASLSLGQDGVETPDPYGKVVRPNAGQACAQGLETPRRFEATAC